MLFASRFLLTLHLTAIAGQALLMLYLIWRQRGLEYQVERVLTRYENDQRTLATEVYQGPATIPMRSFPRKPEGTD